MDVRSKNVLKVSAVAGLATSLLSQLAPVRAIRHESTLAAALDIAFSDGIGSVSKRDSAGFKQELQRPHQRQSPRAHGRATSKLARLLLVFVTLLHVMLRIDWLKYIGSPSVANGMCALVPATWLVIKESLLVAKLGRYDA